MLQVELMLGSMGAASDLCLCQSVLADLGFWLEQRIQPASHCDGSVLSAWGPSGGQDLVFRSV